MKNRKFINFIVRRYLRFDPNHPFIFISLILSLLGVVVGVAALMVAMGILNGMDGELRKKLKILDYPLTIYRIDGQISRQTLLKLERQFPDFKFSPYLETTAIAVSNGQVRGLLLYGVQFKREEKLNPILAKGIRGISHFGLFDIVVGDRLFGWLGIGIGEKATFIFTRYTPIGLGVSPLFKKMRVIGKFHSGLSSFDWGIGYANIEGLRRILGRRGFDGIHLSSPDPFRDKKRIERFLGPDYYVVGWWEQNQNFFAALKLEKRAVFLVLMLIVIVAALNIVSSLLMMVMSRRKEIALMVSLGASPGEVRAIFLKLGVVVGVIGIVVGSIIGGVGLWVLSHFQIIQLPKGVYGVDHLVIDLKFTDYLLIIGGTFLITLLSSLYPAHKAAKVDVLSTLRYE